MSLRSPCLRRTSIAPATWRPASAARSTTPLWACAHRSTSRSASGSPRGPRARIGRPSTRRPILTCTRTSGDARLCDAGGKRTSRRRSGFWAAARAGGESAERSNSSPFMGRWPEGPEGLQGGAAPSPGFAGYFPINGEGLLDQGQLARLDDRFQLRVHAQLATEAADVRAHGRVADPQLVGDLAARRAFRHEPQDFLLARGQTLELGLDLAPGVQQLGDGPRREQRPAIGDGPDGVDDVLRCPRLVDESACPGLQGGETRGVAVLPGEEDELCLRPQLANSSRCVRAGPVGQPEVDQDEVRLELRGACDRVRHGARMPNDRHVLLVVDERGQAFGDHLVVFHDEDPRRVALHRHIYTLDSVSGSQNSTDPTDLWLDSSAEADWTASSTSRGPTAAAMAGPTGSRSLHPSLAMRLTGVYVRVPDARESSSKYSRVFPRPAAFIKRRGARTGCFSGAPCDKGRKVGWLEVAMEVLADSHQGYSSESRSFLVARRAFGLVNGSTSQILVRPFVVLAARVLGPGPTRLRLVKLAHTLDRDARFVVPEKGGAHGEDRPSVTPTSRAA